MHVIDKIVTLFRVGTNHYLFLDLICTVPDSHGHRNAERLRVWYTSYQILRLSNLIL